MKRSKIQPIADNLISKLAPFCKEGRLHIAGSLRRECDECGDLEIVLNTNTPTKIGLTLVQEGFNVKGTFSKESRYVKLWARDVSHLQIDLFIPSPDDYFRQLAIRTGSANFAHNQLAGQWRKIGWVGTNLGLRLESECVKTKTGWECTALNPTLPPVWESEEAFFEFLQIPFIDPNKRF